MYFLDELKGVMTHREQGGKVLDDSERVKQTGGPNWAYRYTKTVPTEPGQSGGRSLGQ